MVTSRQFIRGVARVGRAMERDAQRAQRQRLAYEKAAQRQALLDASADAAAEYDQHVALLTGGHKTSFARRDWLSLANATPPEDPVRRDNHERAAAYAHDNYVPSWFAKLLGFDKGRRAALAAAVRTGRDEDDKLHQKASSDVDRRRKEIEFAQSLTAGDSGAISTALRDHADFSGIAIEGISVCAVEGRVLALVDGLEEDDMPTQSVTLLQSGKASIKPQTTSKIADMHRDNLCGSAIAVAVEFLKVLPIEAVEVVVNTDLLDSATGHIRSTPVIYGRVTAQAISTVNLPRAEATPLAERLGFHFDWSKRDRFRRIDLNAFDVPKDLFDDHEAS